MDDEKLFMELQQIKKDIHFHNYRYHVLDDPIISDYEYDQLMKRLQSIEKDHPEWVTNDSPSRRAGAKPLEKFVKIKHPASILSLANAFNGDDLQAWYDRILALDPRVKDSGFVVEPKIDGLTVVLHYLNGQFIKGATRGDGEVGEDITENLRTVKAIPLVIPLGEEKIHVPERFVVRGEVFIFSKDFEVLNKKLEESGQKTYLNPRNTAAGSLRQLDPSLTAERPLTILNYAIVDSSEETPSTQWETLVYLKKLGFPVSNLCDRINTIGDVIQRIPQWNEERDQIPFEVDGVVIKLNDLRVARDLGFVGKDPRGAIALKYPAREVTTKLNDIGVNIGRTGVLTPYAILEPVEVGGVIVKQATLHNFDFINEKDIRINDRVLIKRAGDVIPYVIGPIKDIRTGEEKVFVIPDRCPVCGQKTEQFEGEVAWYCVNSGCPAQLVRNVEHFVSRGAMEITGLGIKIVEQIVAEGLVKDVADLYSLKKVDLLRLEGFGDKKADNLLEAIQASKTQPLGRLINALGIHGVGEVMAADLTKHFSNLEDLSKATPLELLGIDGVGPNIAEAIVDWFKQPGNRSLLEKLKKVEVWPNVEINLNMSSPRKFDNLIFVITGTLPTLSRDTAKALIESNGGKVTDSVSKNTNYLLVGENAGSKLDKAISLGIQQLSENDLYKLISGEK